MRKKAKLLPSDMDDGIFTQAEITVLCTLMEIYGQALSADGSISTTVLRRCNRQGLFELGVRSKEAAISKLLVHYPHHIIAENIIIAHGYLKGGF